MQIETCEICGRQFIAGYGYSIAASWLVTGSAYVGAYMCDKTAEFKQADENAPQHTGQHWGCTPEHAVEALQKCLADPAHMHPDGLRARHKESHKRLEADGSTTYLPRYADSDAHWAAGRGEEFHIVEFKL